MSRFARLEVLNEITAVGIVPVFYHADFEVAKKVVLACLEAGIRTVEFTNRGDNAYRVFSDLEAYFAKAAPQVMLGSGSIVDPASAGIYIASGSNFVVGPTLNSDVARICNRRKISYSPGCASVSEISNAEELGVEIVKIFPGDIVGGPQFVKAVLAPMPWVRIMPTGGVEATQESLAGWFKAGGAAVGIGSNLIRKEWLQRGEYEKITELAVKVKNWAYLARGKPLFTGLDHICLYPAQSGADRELTAWYSDLFGLKIVEREKATFLEGSSCSRIEISKVQYDAPAHLAIQTSDFSLACETLAANGVELEPPIIQPEMKVAFLKQTDPAGNRVHIVWRK
jgi:2-dehydro-3-deoxyphosphogluconate aldolase / (4S)-4-hydroxy-2-oxoglutarate aldolase